MCIWNWIVGNADALQALASLLALFISVAVAIANQRSAQNARSELRAEQARQRQRERPALLALLAHSCATGTIVSPFIPTIEIQIANLADQIVTLEQITFVVTIEDQSGPLERSVTPNRQPDLPCVVAPIGLTSIENLEHCVFKLTLDGYDAETILSMRVETTARSLSGVEETTCTAFYMKVSKDFTVQPNRVDLVAPFQCVSTRAWLKNSIDSEC